MPTPSLQDKLRSHIDRFVEELSAMIKEDALETMRQALDTTGPLRNGPGRPKKAASSPAKRGAARRGRRRSATDVEAVATAIVDHVQANPGCSVSEVGAAIGLTTKDLQLPVRKLVEDGKLRTTGQRRGTRYFPGSGRPKAAKKVTRKASKKRAKKATKKTARKSTKKAAVRKRSKRAA